MNASLDITEDELRMTRRNEDIEEKLYNGPLRDFMHFIVDLLETDSEESQSREKEKGTMTPTIIYSPMSDSQLDRGSSTSSTSPTQPRYPSTYVTPTTKRKISDTSFETHSTETTPTKLVQPEAKVQSLQNTFVNTIINKLWYGKIDIPWARGRHMFLTYTECIPSHSSLMIGQTILLFSIACEAIPTRSSLVA
jgi:hypothetical protein